MEATHLRLSEIERELRIWIHQKHLFFYLIESFDNFPGDQKLLESLPYLPMTEEEPETFAGNAFYCASDPSFVEETEGFIFNSDSIRMNKEEEETFIEEDDHEKELVRTVWLAEGAIYAIRSLCETAIQHEYQKQIWDSLTRIIWS